MPMAKVVNKRDKMRVLIAGAPNSGKTFSLATFIYGQYAHLAEREVDALQYATDKSMVILNCPGEKGLASLPEGEHISSYSHVTDEGETSTSIVKDFVSLTGEILTGFDKIPNILAIDGIHNLYAYMLDALTSGAYFKGDDFDSRLYGRCHSVFGNYLSAVYQSNIPLIICTTWEEWENRDDNVPPGTRNPVKYLYPALPGKMAKAICGHFDATLSARLERRCMHPTCTDSKANKEHYVWQFLPKGDVRGVGIKGLSKVSDFMVERPYMHQYWPVLEHVIKTSR